MTLRLSFTLRSRAALRVGAALLALLFVVLRPAAAQVFEVGDRLIVGRTPIQSGMATGAALVAGDLDGDGRPELVLGEPSRDQLEIDSGGVTLLSGAPAHGITPRIGIAGVGFETHSGSALALGDFDGDGALELAVGDPGAASSGFAGAGRVRIWVRLFGTVEFHELDQDSAGVADESEASDRFGAALAAGDFDGDGFDDLAIGAPGEGVGDLAEAGVVHVLYGGAEGLTGAGSDLWLPGAAGVPGAPGATAHFGFALAAGDFDGDGFDELAIGAPGADLSGPEPLADAGRVLVLRGSATGLVAAGALDLLESSLAAGASAAGDEFGWALAAGDFDRTAECVAAKSCADELAIGVPGKELSQDTPSAGQVMVVTGAFGPGLDLDHTRSFNPFLFGREIQADARFGAALAVGEAGGVGAGDRADDLAIGEPRRDLEAIDAGMVYLLFGRGDLGLAANRSQQLTARSGLASAPARDGDHFGAALVIADLDADGNGDLAIGIPGRDLTVQGMARDDAGAVEVLWGALFADGFERGTADGWSLP